MCNALFACLHLVVKTHCPAKICELQETDVLLLSVYEQKINIYVSLFQPIFVDYHLV